MVLVVSCRGGRAAGGQILARSAFLPEEMRVHAQRWLIGSLARCRDQSVGGTTDWT